MSMGLTKSVALAAPKIFQLRRTVGERDLIKLLVAILRAFVDSVKADHKPDAADLMEAAEHIASTYTHDSVKDLMLALKEARLGGMKVYYSSLDVATIYGFIKEYFEKKAAYLENAHQDQKATGIGAEQMLSDIVGITAPKLLENVAQSIPDDHPNADTLRRKLTITKGREKRGIITPEQAEQQRAEAREATQRKSRPDWKPSPEAQKQIDRRHRAEDRRLAEQYRSRS